ncbi:MAG: hypothetical protein P4L53_23620 [Candidatus Obscuribacterales bacterium]|nr:hypothetical protein [Candidatus Obscuribacterales bacterium]
MSLPKVCSPIISAIWGLPLLGLTAEIVLPKKSLARVKLGRSKAKQGTGCFKPSRLFSSLRAITYGAIERHRSSTLLSVERRTFWISQSLEQQTNSFDFCQTNASGATLSVLRSDTSFFITVVIYLVNIENKDTSTSICHDQEKITTIPSENSKNIVTERNRCAGLSIARFPFVRHIYIE